MNHTKGSAATIVAVLGIIILGGIGYFAMNQMPQSSATESAESNDMNFEWRFTDAGESDGYPYTNVTLLADGSPREIGKFMGSCSEIGVSGGIDGKGLLAGELSAAQCWYAGGGDEIGVFAVEDGGYEVMVGGLSEGEEGGPMFRGDFKIRTDIQL